MSLSLKIKTEKAFAEYIPTVLTVGDLNIYEGHNPPADNSVMEFPALVVYAESSEPHPDMPYEMGVKIINLKCRFFVDSETSNRNNLDTWKDELEQQMRTIADIKLALNKPISGDDNRTYKAIHFHDVVPTDEPSDREGTDWVEEMSYDIIVEPLAE